ncbi:MAG TPA: S46 family peptidase [Candidatus Limnocylindria bacterium]|nr:S46 family peptidase [Candidatus Limnocylindria bacterium]
MMTPLIASLALGPAAVSDEGMWLYNNPPREQIKAKYGFELTDAWLDHLMKSSVRFNSGGSGSFVSEDGLVISNHHVGADALQKVGSKEKDYLKEGFYAAQASEEIRCVDLELNVLQSIEDVTAKVNAAIPAGVGAEAAFKARLKAMLEIESESFKSTGLRSDVVTLYQGGAYHLYRFKRYTDVRLVFAPEQQIAFYGGDPDNFEYPRFDLDICLFRVYEDGKPVKVTNYLKWSKNGAKEGDLTFVSGHPGRTDRLLTTTELEYLRDTAFPYQLERLKRREVLIRAWSERSAENARRAKEDLFGIQNSRKARDGGHAGLYDPLLMASKAKSEGDFRARLAGKPEYAVASAAYDRITQAQEVIGKNALRYRLLEGENGFTSESFALARRLLRAGAERPKPNGERLREFSEASKQSLELALFSDKPIYEDLEILTLADSLTLLAEKLGYQDALVAKVLAGKSPRARAADLILHTKVRDVAFRKKLYESGADAVAAENDPLIELARLVDPESRDLRKLMETQDEIKQQAHAAISKAQFALDGANTYPDATFTLRLSYGTVKGYQENGKSIPANTVFSGLYQRAKEMDNKPPFDLPARWQKQKSSLGMDVPLNFVGTHDIIGGNSGSPVVNTQGEFVGIIFDGNLPSLVLDFAYEDVQARSVSVHSAGILEALRKVYRVGPLADELATGKRKH